MTRGVRRFLSRFSQKRPVRSGRKVRRIIALMLAALLVFAGWSYFESRIEPIVEQMALSRVKYLASKSMNDAINEEIVNGAYKYDDLVFLEKNEDGYPVALKTNMIKINQLKGLITRKVLDKIAAIETSELSIPLGNVLNGDLLSGRGPRIPVHILPVGSVSANFSNLFTSSGINQTRHQVVMEVVVNIGVVMPGKSIGTDVKVSVNVAETIIIGVVPESFTYFDETVTTAPDTNAQKYFDMR